MSGKPVLLIGAIRSTGLLAARILREREIPVRILARNPAAAREPIGRDVEIVSGDVTKKDTLVSAFHGVSHVVFTAGVRSGRFAREAVVKATEYDGVLNTIAASALNVWKSNTLLWRRRAEDAIRSSGLDYAVVRVTFLLNRPLGEIPFAIEVQISALTMEQIVYRTSEYAKKGIYVLWLALYQSALEENRYSPRARSMKNRRTVELDT